MLSNVPTPNGSQKPYIEKTIKLKPSLPFMEPVLSQTLRGKMSVLTKRLVSVMVRPFLVKFT